jgi:hypothetical protein
MKTHNFNLTQLEKEKIEGAISALFLMTSCQKYDFQYLAEGYFELIYGIEKADKIIDFLEDKDSLILEFNEGEFLEVHKDIKEIK